jgi:hypothetical protein
MKTDPEILQAAGWRSAAQIIEVWNRETGRSDTSTIAGQVLARVGKHRDPEMRTQDGTNPKLYSPAAQVIIRTELDKRRIRSEPYERR